MVPVHVLDADEARLGPAEVAPAALAVDAVAAADDAVEEVVRREEREVAAEVAVALGEVVLVRRHVLVVAGEDDQVVGVREPVAAGDGVEVVVGEEVRLLAVQGEPAHEAAVVAVVVGRHASVDEGPREEDGMDSSVGIPRVAVLEVVRLPGVRR